MYCLVLFFVVICCLHVNNIVINMPFQTGKLNPISVKSFISNYALPWFLNVETEHDEKKNSENELSH